MERTWPTVFFYNYVRLSNFWIEKWWNAMRLAGYYSRIPVLGFNTLVINSESPIMHQCHIIERIRSTLGSFKRASPDLNFIFIFLVSSIFCLLCEFESLYLLEEGCLISLLCVFPCIFLCVSITMYDCICLSIKEDFSLSFIQQWGKHHTVEGRNVIFYINRIL